MSFAPRTRVAGPEKSIFSSFFSTNVARPLASQRASHSESPTFIKVSSDTRTWPIETTQLSNTFIAGPSSPIILSAVIVHALIAISLENTEFETDIEARRISLIFRELFLGGDKSPSEQQQKPIQ
ncbi:hypothetical protein [Candidatus Thiodiazotropha sp. LNASS1]|uniref:hypothetical protein n=1 Tax=Candidatus Thiodiazotropha sp. LNASS1 TaxID=3096260 RepID=UPI0034DEC2E4